jgi:hypothetical protein
MLKDPTELEGFSFRVLGHLLYEACHALQIPTTSVKRAIFGFTRSLSRCALQLVPVPHPL